MSLAVSNTTHDFDCQLAVVCQVGWWTQDFRCDTTQPSPDYSGLPLQLPAQVCKSFGLRGH